MATHPRLHRRIVATRDVCATLQMVTLTVQPAAWEWAWEWTGIALGITHPSLFTRRREKIETINYPPLGTSIPVNNFCCSSPHFIYFTFKKKLMNGRREKHTFVNLQIQFYQLYMTVNDSVFTFFSNTILLFV